MGQQTLTRIAIFQQRDEIVTGGAALPVDPSKRDRNTTMNSTLAGMEIETFRHPDVAALRTAREPEETPPLASDRAIRYVVASSSLGSTVVAEMDGGVCAVLLGDEPAELEEDLAGRFRGFLLSRDAEPSMLAKRVIERIDLAAPDGDNIPLKLNGTEFQQLVWTALREIPSGQTMTYAKVAERIGRPGSIRAVARACGANPVAVLVPCHRVLRSDGSISGYRWGVERKRALLERERAGTT